MNFICHVKKNHTSGISRYLVILNKEVRLTLAPVKLAVERKGVGRSKTIGGKMRDQDIPAEKIEGVYFL